MALFAAALLVVVGCAASDRPEAAEWQTEWQAIVDVIPDESEIGDPPSEDLCRTTLADVRTLSEDLLPAPTASIDDLANEWVSLAEEAFFDCPPEGQDVDSFEDAYNEMRRVQNSIETALADSE